jgi:hypothetical protein
VVGDRDDFHLVVTDQAVDHREREALEQVAASTSTG